jgi:predicted transcriptional regulator
MQNFLAENKDYFGLGLKSIDLHIIAQIEEFQRNNCDCCITNEQLSFQFGESLATIKRSIAKLEELNIVTRSTNFIKGHGRNNKQRILSVNDKSEWKLIN